MNPEVASFPIISVLCYWSDTNIFNVPWSTGSIIVMNEKADNLLILTIFDNNLAFRNGLLFTIYHLPKIKPRDHLWSVKTQVA